MEPVDNGHQTDLSVIDRLYCFLSINRAPVEVLAWNKLATSLLASHGEFIVLLSLSTQTCDEIQLEKKWETRLASKARIIK